MNAITLEAFAKINLALDITGRRKDGYHELNMIMQMINLSDTITIEKTQDTSILLTTNDKDLPTDKHNLIYQAAQLLKSEFDISEGISIHLEKRIPVAAGLAGGSSDCATTLLGINSLFELGLSQNKLMEYGLKLGADVPYCILQGTALAQGIGEILTPLPAPPACDIILIKPNINVSTAWAYQNFKLSELQKHPDINGMVTALQKQDFSSICEKMENVLETVTIPAYPVIQEIKETLLHLGAENSLMSGSGPTVFGLFTNHETAKNAFSICQNMYKDYQVALTDFFYER